VSDDAINAQITVLNNAYARWGFQFALQGAVDRVANSAFFGFNIDTNAGWSAQTAMKESLRKGGAAALNLYITDVANGILGYATFPDEFAWWPKDDGVVVLASSLPGVAPSSPYNGGDTATHEVGHWLGLYHTFQGGCAKNAKKGGDMVADTAAEKTPNFDTCTGLRNTCKGKSGAMKGNDPVKNFMDYSDDACMDSFTAGQATRMLKQYITYRLGR